ncbi:MAG: hypothetical protein IJ684_00870 [Bacteroidales bacterium]|nr:hypothetical protein [Bacteroidales bacterium]
MQLKDKLKQDAGLQYVVEALEVMSAAGRRTLLEQPWLTDVAALEQEASNVELTVRLMREPANKMPFVEMRHQMMELHDLRGTVSALAHHTVVDEIELFEIKSFAYHTMRTARAADQVGLSATLALPDVQAVFDLLDPDHTGMPNFYVYDSYDPRLQPLREQLRGLQSQLAAREREAAEPSVLAPLQQAISDLLEKQSAVQAEVVARLCETLWTQAALLDEALRRMGYTDVLIAKAVQADDWHLCRPTYGGDDTRYASLWFPRLRHVNEQRHLRYQPIDVALQPGVCFITGANMAGKTVLLKTLSCAQLMAQFGMFVPAEEAQVSLVDDVVACIGDEQNEMKGLSSYASEIIKISHTLERAAEERLLILVDEPARTTNPVEGKAIVQALAGMLNGSTSQTMITTHYSGLGTACRRLRVRGFVESMDSVPLSPDTINRFMDYTLLADESDEVPQEALRIATILGCHPELIARARALQNP